MTESWDDDPEARLTAANIASQLQVLQILPDVTEGILSSELEAEATCGRIEQIGAGSQIQHTEIIISPSESSQNSADSPQLTSNSLKEI